MEFRNMPVNPDALPAFEQVPLSPVSSRFAPYRALGSLLVWWPLALVLWALPATERFPADLQFLAVVLIAVGGTLLAILGWFEARRRAYALRERDLLYHQGLLIQRTTILPIGRIQHVETLSGPLERAFGLVRLTCFTAGGASADLAVEGLERDTAERLRQYLLDRIPEADMPPQDSA